MEVFVNYFGSTCHSNMFYVIFPTLTSPLTVLCMSQQPTADRIRWVCRAGCQPASTQTCRHTEEHFLASCEPPERCYTAKNISFGA